MELLDVLVFLGVMKVVGIAILFIISIPFIIGLAIGWFVRGAV